MKKEKILKISIITVLIAIVLALNINKVFGAINVDYYNEIKSSIGVNNTNVDKAAESSPLLDALALLVYAVGSLLEKILGAIFEAMTGDNVFPWADAILFNAIPLLDINVFNPSGASLIAVLQGIISDVYWTVFSLALSFFGIAIMVTAIKLAVSTIASDKALYKQAVMKWLMGFIMLWGIHFFMSFAIYLNEQLVIAAQKLASENIGNTVFNIEQLINTDEQDYLIVANFIETMTGENSGNFAWKVFAGFVVAAVVAVSVGLSLVSGTWVAAGMVAALKVVGATAATAGAIITAGGITATAIGEYTVWATEARVDIDEWIYSDDNFDITTAKNVLTGNYGIAAELLRNDNYVSNLEYRLNLKLRGDAEDGNPFTNPGSTSDRAVKLVAFDVAAIIAKGTDDELMIGDNADKVKYIDLLKSYVNGIDALLDYDRRLVIKRSPTEDINKDVISYYQGKSNPTFQMCTTGEDCSEVELYALKFDATSPDSAANPALKVNYDEVYYNHAKMMVSTYDSFGTSVENPNTNFISTLANGFKKIAWTYTSSSWQKTRATIEGALLYAILVAQSLIFFIAYAKRLFYIIILIVMAPVVVVYDFFNKFSS